MLEQDFTWYVACGGLSTFYGLFLGALYVLDRVWKLYARLK